MKFETIDAEMRCGVTGRAELSGCGGFVDENHTPAHPLIPSKFLLNKHVAPRPTVQILVIEDRGLVPRRVDAVAMESDVWLSPLSELRRSN